MSALLLTVFNVSFAQEVSLDFTTNVWGLPESNNEKATEAAQFTDGIYTIGLQGSEGGGYYCNYGYLLLGKAGATLTLPPLNFDVEKIVIGGTIGASSSVKQNIFVGATPVSTETTGAKNVDNVYDIDEAYQSAGTIYVLKVLSNHNTQVSRIDIYKKGSTTPTKATPEISFEPNAISVVLGESVTPPTLTYNGDGQVTFSSNNEQVARVEGKTGALTILTAGTATIKATASETDNYKSGSATYSLTVKTQQPDLPTDAIWAENWQQSLPGTLVEDVMNPSASYKGDGQYVKLYGATTDENNIELLIPKNSRGVDFQADVKLNGKGENLTLTYYANHAIKVSTATAGAVIGEPYVASNIYSHTVSVPDGTDVLNLTFATKTDTNARLDNITLTDSSAEKTLTISGATSFTTSTTVTITPSNDDFIVYYTLDGTEPKLSSTSQTYSQPFVLTETTTVKAVEEDYAGELSPVVMKTFVKQETPEIVTVNNIAEFKALPDKTEATLTLENAEVLYNSGTDIYIRDESGAIDFYNTGLEPHINAGYAISGTVTGISTRYNGIPELTKSSNTNDLNLVANDNWTVHPKNLTIAQAKKDIYLCDLIKFTDVYVTSVEREGTTNIYAYVGKDSLLLYDRFKEGFGQFEPDKTYNVYGILVLYKGDYELYITESLAPNVMQTCNNIEEFVRKAYDREMNLVLNDAQVVYASGNDAYVRDASGAIDFYKIGFELKTNQILNGSVIGMGTVYRGTPEITKSPKTNADDISITDGPEAEPIVTTIARLIRNHSENGKSVSYEKTFCNLVQVENVLIEESKGYLYAVEGNDRIRVYDKFKVLGEDFTAGVTVTIKGIHLLYENGSNSELQIMPIAYTITSGISDVSREDFTTGPAYNMAGQRVDNNFKGIVIQKRHKFIRK